MTGKPLDMIGQSLAWHLALGATSKRPEHKDDQSCYMWFKCSNCVVTLDKTC